MRVLLTGGAGYIGSQTAKALALGGLEPIVLDNLTSGHRWAVRWGPFIQGNAGDADLVQATLREHRVEAVIHFAANAYVGESLLVPHTYFHNNVTNTLSMLGAMHDAGVTTIVFSSSCATYGKPISLPIREDHPQHPISPYGDSKLFVERVLRWYGEAYGLRWIVLRYFNAAGADPEGDLGELHEPETHLIPVIIQTALGQRPCVDINGVDHPTPDGTAVRDYIHVCDLANAHVQALQHLLKGTGNCALNLGTGKGYSVLEIISAVEAVANRPVPRREAPRRPGDPPELVADPSAAAEALDWRARMSGLRTIIDSAWAWHSGKETRVRTLG